MGALGAELLPAAGTVLTHCNAGALATCGYGTALGVIRAAVERGHKIDVFADETRPFLQGARLTAWELHEGQHPHHRHLRQHGRPASCAQGKLQAVIVGADRIAANGDAANKIGTYARRRARQGARHPLLRRRPALHHRPRNTHTATDIPIEQRSPTEVTHSRTASRSRRITSESWNPAFDVTPAKYVTAIITERGVLRAPYPESLERLSHEAAVPA